MFIDPYSPVPRDIVHSLLHLRIHFASGTLPRDLLNRGSLHSLFVDRHKAVGWRFETSRQDQPTFRLLFHDPRTLETAGEWFQYAAGYWRSNNLQAAEVYVDPAGTSQLWYWSEMSEMFRQSFGVRSIVGVDVERSVEGQGWTPFAFERKTSWSSRRRDPSTRWAPVGCEASDFGGGAPLAKRVSARQASAEPPFPSNTDDCGTSLTLAARVAEEDGAEIAAVEDAPSSEAQKEGEGTAAEAHVAAEEGEVVEEAVDARADVQAVKGEGEGEDVEMG